MGTNYLEKPSDVDGAEIVISDHQYRGISPARSICESTSAASELRTARQFPRKKGSSKDLQTTSMPEAKSSPNGPALSGDTLPSLRPALALVPVETAVPRETSHELRPTIHLIEDDPILRQVTREFFQDAGYIVQSYYSAESFLSAPRPKGDACLVVDMMLPGISGVELLQHLQLEGCDIPAIMLTGRDDASTAVSAFKAGAVDFIEKPAEQSVLIKSVSDAIGYAREMRSRSQERDQATACFAKLTPRESEVLLMVLDGAPSKNIAADLGISQRTVEYHRASIMRKTSAASIPELMQLFIIANSST